MNISLLTIQYPQISKLWELYKSFKFGTSFKISNIEGGQNCEDVMICIASKGVFFMGVINLTYDGPKNRGEYIPKNFGAI